VAAARRAFLCDGLLKDGAPPGQIVAAIGFAPPPPRATAGSRRAPGRHRRNDETVRRRGA
jgi:hypothetical protein